MIVDAVGAGLCFVERNDFVDQQSFAGTDDRDVTTYLVAVPGSLDRTIVKRPTVTSAATPFASGLAFALPSAS